MSIPGSAERTFVSGWDQAGGRQVSGRIAPSALDYPAPMDEPAVRQHAQAMCDAIVAGDVDRAIEDFSPELRRNLGEVIGLMPLPSREAAIESVTQGGSSYLVVLRLTGESEEVQVQTRWKDRDGRPTVVEASHLSSREVQAEAAELDESGDRGQEGASE